MGNTFQFAWEVALIEWCQTSIPSFVISALKILSNVGDTLFIVGILAFVYLCYDKQIGRKTMANLLIIFMISGEIKNICKRRRPYFDNESIKCLKPVEKEYDIYDINKQGFSFPSMHSANIVNVTGTISTSLKNKILITLSVIFSLIVGISRFALGCHYPTDVILGWTLGLIGVTFGSKLFDILTNKQLYILEMIVGLSGCLFCDSLDFYQMFGITVGFILVDILDNHHTKFKNTRNPIKIIARLLFAAALFLSTYELLKIAFPSEIVENNYYVIFRYGASTFMGLGISPLVYKYNLLKLDDKTKEDL